MEVMENINRLLRSMDDEKVQDNSHKYGPKIKVSGWEMQDMSLPYDNVSHDERISRYIRLGSHIEPTPESCTRESYKSVTIKKHQLRPGNIRRPMVNIISFPTTLGAKRRAAFELAGLREEHPNTNKLDYLSESAYSFVVPYPQRPRFVDREEYYRVETKYRKLHTGTMDPTKPTTCKYIDELPENSFKPDRKKIVEEPPYLLDHPIKEHWSHIEIRADY